MFHRSFDTNDVHEFLFEVSSKRILSEYPCMALREISPNFSWHGAALFKQISFRWHSAILRCSERFLSVIILQPVLLMFWPHEIICNAIFFVFKHQMRIRYNVISLKMGRGWGLPIPDWPKLSILNLEPIDLTTAICAIFSVLFSYQSVCNSIIRLVFHFGVFGCRMTFALFRIILFSALLW